MQVIITNTAAKDLRKMPKRDAAAILVKLDIYATKGVGDVTKLQGRDGYRLRHGKYRAIFEINGDVIVLIIAHRSKVYK
ncbi:MAG: type II toxin-antitoxin system RelE/ParE family toxin [Paracoccaceae bacterium]